MIIITIITVTISLIITIISFNQLCYIKRVFGDSKDWNI